LPRKPLIGGKKLTFTEIKMKKLLALAIFAANPLFAQEIDNRQVINLNPMQRNQVLTEMRALLAATQNIAGALAKDDMAAVAESAKAVGFNMKHKAENPLHSVLPKQFMMLGMSMHKDFDVIAEEITTLNNPKHTLQQLSETLAKCSACHATYQIQVSSTINQASAARLDEVASRGSHVMPFSLEQTTHVFTKTETGGIQQVIVKNKANTDQIKLIRQHLGKISEEFKHGDFSNPAKVHGNNMPGLSELRKAKPGELQVSYRELADGAEITYQTNNPWLQNGLHQWFDAQLSDHARHAVAGHGGHMMHGR
jgi:hypothetical protein